MKNVMTNYELTQALIKLRKRICCSSSGGEGAVASVFGRTGITLPVASNFTESGQLSGAGGIIGRTPGVTLYAQTTDNLGVINFETPIDTVTITLHVQFTYQIL